MFLICGQICGKRSRNVPDFFSGKLTLGESLGSSPQKHSGTFPNFFREADFRKNGLSSPQKHSGTFPSVFGDCFQGFPLKSASPKKIRERSRVFLETAPENFPKVSLPKKISGTFPSVFRDCFRGFPRPPRKKQIGKVPECFGGFCPKSASLKKIRERSRLFLGTASEGFP